MWAHRHNRRGKKGEGGGGAGEREGKWEAWCCSCAGVGRVEGPSWGRCRGTRSASAGDPAARRGMCTAHPAISATAHAVLSPGRSGLTHPPPRRGPLAPAATPCEQGGGGGWMRASGGDDRGGAQWSRGASQSTPSWLGGTRGGAWRHARSGGWREKARLLFLFLFFFSLPVCYKERGTLGRGSPLSCASARPPAHPPAHPPPLPIRPPPAAACQAAPAASRPLQPRPPRLPCSIPTAHSPTNQYRRPVVTNSHSPNPPPPPHPPPLPPLTAAASCRSP